MRGADTPRRPPGRLASILAGVGLLIIGIVTSAFLVLFAGILVLTLAGCQYVEDASVKRKTR